MTYSCIVLCSIDGKYRHFMYADEKSARLGWERYVKQAAEDLQKYGEDAHQNVDEQWICSKCKIRYGLAVVAEVTWSANLFLKLGFEP